jgi:hypothetical protein
MSRDDSGPAFPIHTPGSAPEYLPGRDGMTLRDYFAAKAMAALIIGMASNEGFRQHAMSGYPDLRLTEAVADL